MRMTKGGRPGLAVETLRSVTITESGEPDIRVDCDYNADTVLIGRKLFNDGTLTEDVAYLVEPGRNLTGYSQVLAEIDRTGESPRTKVLNTFSHQIKAQTRHEPNQSLSHTLHTDGLGSIRSLAMQGESTQSPEAYNYEAFGATTSGDRSQTSYSHTGERLSNITELQLACPRY